MSNTKNHAIPDGRYIAQYLGETSFDNGIKLEFNVSVGQYKNQRLFFSLTSKIAKIAVIERSGMWLDWMQFEGDSLANKLCAILSHAGYDPVFVAVEGGVIINVTDPYKSKKLRMEFYNELSIDWSISKQPGSDQNNLNSCMLFNNHVGRIPAVYWSDAYPNEGVLGEWLQAAIDPNGLNYYHPACLWVNELFYGMGGTKEYVPADQYGWPKLWLNRGFECIPPSPRINP
jgi:hypothetical protein